MAILAAAGLLFAAVSTPPSAAAGPRAASSVTVLAAGGDLPFTWEWDPAEVTIRRRGHVTWENPTEATHHVTFWDGPGGKHQHLDPGGSATLKLTKPGVYKYWCDITFHAELVDVPGYGRVCVGMCGEITVQ
ncbi:MAG: hypothetical protein M3273_00315 [Actinomycetota bacterium]|nr:hypothetical protein [Actinomycetota bacterium]